MTDESIEFPLDLNKAEQLVEPMSRMDLAVENLEGIPRQQHQIRPEQVENDTGAYVFQVSDVTRVRRFLIFGSPDGTYKSHAEKLSLKHADGICNIVREGNGFMVLKELAEINSQNRNPKMSPMLLTLAVCARYNVHNVKNCGSSTAEACSEYISKLHQAAFALVPEVCRIPTHLFEFVSYCEEVSKSTKIGSQTSTGWGRLMRKTISNWYGAKTAEKLAMFLTKYPQREGWSHRDLFRLSHPVLSKLYKDFETRPDRLELEQIYRYAVKGNLLPRKRKITVEDKEEEPKKVYTDEQMDHELNSRPLNLIEAYLALKHEKNEEVISEAIKKFGLVREHLPTDCLNSKLVWKSLIENMTLEAITQNLGKMSSIGCLSEKRIEKICDQLTSEKELKKSRLHPMTLLTARAMYLRGHGKKGEMGWSPEPKILKALEDGFYKSFVKAPPTNKRFCVALDISKYMIEPCSSFPLSCIDVASAMSLINLQNEEQVQCVAFCENLIELPFSKTWDINRINAHMKKLDFGATDCSHPMVWAAENNLKFDVFIIYTDEDTWAGDVHPFEAIKQYREQSGIKDAKVIVMGLQSASFTIVDPLDKGMLNVVGFDSAVLRIIHEFITESV